MRTILDKQCLSCGHCEIKGILALKDGGYIYRIRCDLDGVEADYIACEHYRSGDPLKKLARDYDRAIEEFTRGRQRKPGGEKNERQGPQYLWEVI